MLCETCEGEIIVEPNKEMSLPQAKIFIPEHLSQYYGDLQPQTVLSSGIDLVVPKDVTILAVHPFNMIDFEIVIKAPEGYHSILLPRSSTFKNWGILQANSIGLVDEDYCGKRDTIKMAALWCPIGGAAAVPALVIPAGARIAQVIFQRNVRVEFSRFEPEDKSRGGFGSTGKGV